MQINMIKAIYLKEITELARDKKTMLFMILLPMLVFPAIFGSIAFFAAKTVQQEQQRELTYLMINGNLVPEFQSLIKEHKDFVAYNGDDKNEIQSTPELWSTLVREGKVDFVLEVSSSHLNDLAADKQSKWKLHFNNAEVTNSVGHRVHSQLAALNKKIVEQKLISLGIGEDNHIGILKPINLENIDIAEAKESLGAKIGGLVSYILLPLCLMGAMYPAIDLGAGEKEKGTLESLLISPVSRLQIVLGKFFTVVTTSLFAAIMALFSLFFWGFIFAQALAVDAIINIVGTIGGLNILSALLMLFPVVLFFSALVLTISIYARSFKEAQNYMGPLTIIVIAPLIIAMLPGINLNMQWAMVPISNVALAVKDILKGQFDIQLLIFVWLFQFLLAAAMLAFSVFWFKQEKVLFR